MKITENCARFLFGMSVYVKVIENINIVVLNKNVEFDVKDSSQCDEMVNTFR